LLSKDPLVHIDQICESIDLIQRFTAGMTMDQFSSDSRTQDAVIRRLQIIGDSVKALPNEVIVSHPEIPWSNMARTRDKVIHHYLELKLETIWETIQKDLPPLKKPLLALRTKLIGGSK